MDETEARALVERIEQTTWPFADWHHTQHLILATWYLTQFDEREAIDRCRRSIVRYNQANGVAQKIDSGYHETLTVFLLRGISAFLAALPTGLRFCERLDGVTRCFADIRAIGRAYFTRERFDSWPARTGWVEPDKRSMSSWLAACKNAGVQRAGGWTLVL